MGGITRLFIPHLMQAAEVASGMHVLDVACGPGYPNLQPDDPYQPSVNIAVGSEYISELKDEFGGLYEAIAASYIVSGQLSVSKFG